MNRLERVIYIAGVGNEPTEQERLPELWRPHGLEVYPTPIDWASSDYEECLEDIGTHIKQVSEVGRVSLVGASGGGKAALSLFARYQNDLHRAVTISAKIDPYDLHPDTQKAYPNLRLSSDLLQVDLEKIDNHMLKKILCVHPLSDSVVRPHDAVLPGTHELTVTAQGHIEGIRQALISYGQNIASFIRATDTSV